MYVICLKPFFFFFLALNLLMIACHGQLLSAVQTQFSSVTIEPVYFWNLLFMYLFSHFGTALPKWNKHVRLGKKKLRKSMYHDPNSPSTSASRTCSCSYEGQSEEGEAKLCVLLSTGKTDNFVLQYDCNLSLKRQFPISFIISSFFCR